MVGIYQPQSRKWLKFSDAVKAEWQLYTDFFMKLFCYRDFNKYAVAYPGRFPGCPETPPPPLPLNNDMVVHILF